MSERADVVIVGARCAGSPLAARLARRGLRVVVLDRSHFPSEVPSTHILQPSGVLHLDEVGALDALWQAGAVPIEDVSLVIDEARIEAGASTKHFGAPALCARRVMLDAILVEAAQAAGAEVRTGTKVRGLIRDNGRVAGVVCDGAEILAPLVVGADGRHSMIATEVGAREYRIAPSARTFLWGYFEGVDTAVRLQLGRIGADAYLSGQTDSGLFMVALALAHDDAQRVLADREQGFAAKVAAWPELADVMTGSTLVGPVRVVDNWYGYFREATGPGWALLGDAGRFKDPIAGQGISDALRDGAQLADAIEAGLSGDSLDQRLREWGDWRDAHGKEMHWFATDLGAAGPVTPLVREVLRGVAADDADTLGLLGVINHDIQPSELFTNARLVRAGARVVRRRTSQVPALIREVRDVVKAESYRRRPATDRAPGR